MSQPYPLRPVNENDQPATGGAARVRGWSVAVVYAALAIWLLRDDAWRYGEALWPTGPMGLPMAVGRVLTWAVLAAMLGFGLSWPVADTRRWVWGMSLPAVVLIPIASAAWWLAPAGLLLHMIAFNPAWLPAAHARGTEMDTPNPEPLFYDGMCGLCHRWVKVVLRGDLEGRQFYFSPLQGEHIKSMLSEAQIAELPDSIVVVTHDRAVLVRSAAVKYILKQLGGWYKLAYYPMVIIPRPLADFGYNCVAKVRHLLFKTPDNACPMTPPEQRSRFKF